MRGYPVGKIAAHLGIDRHTIKKWKRALHFVEAMENLRREMTAAIISPAAKASPPPRAMDPLASWMQANARFPRNDGGQDDVEYEEEEEEEVSDEEAAQTEAWVEQIIAAKREGREIPPPPPSRGSL